MFYNVACNTELVNAKPLLLGGVNIKSVQPCGCNIFINQSTDQYVTLFYVCFCLNTSYLLYIVDC